MSQRKNEYPNDAEAEESILGGLMTDPVNIHTAMAQLNVDDFFIEPHKIVFRAIGDLVSQNFPVDVVTVGNLLKIRKQQSIKLNGFVGGFVGNFDAHIRVVKNLSKRRRAQALMEDARGEVGTTGDIDAMIARHCAEMMAITTDRRNDPVSLGDAGLQAMKDIEKAMSAGDEGAGIKTGFAGWDQHTGGMFLTDQIVIGARPGVGKTVLATNICTNAALNKVHSLIVNVEMPAAQIATRVLSSKTGIENFQLRRGKIADEDIYKVGQEGGLLYDLPVWILAERNWNRAVAQVKAMKYQNPMLSIVVWDYLQDFEYDGRHGMERRLALSEMSRQGKALAKDLGLVSILLSQIDRKNDKDNKAPVMADLRECGDIEQHGDFITFLHPNSKYNARTDWIIRKARNAPIGTVPLTELKETVSFIDWDGV